MEYFNGAPLRHLADVVAMGADRYGEKTAFTSFGEALSYAGLDEESNRVANMLVDHGVEPGDRVALFVPNTNQFPETYFGVLKSGAVAVPLNLRMDPETLVYVLRDSGADYLVGTHLFADEVRELASAADVGTLFLSGFADETTGIVDYVVKAEYDTTFDRAGRGYDDIACQLYTSGTTGRPKGVLLTHENLLTTIEEYGRSALAVNASDSTVLVLPLFHIYAINVLMGTYLYRGATMHLQPKPDGEAMLSGIEEHGATTFAGVPAMYTMMWQVYRENPDRFDLSSLRTVYCGAAPLADETRRTIEEAWDAPMVEGWAMTETAGGGAIEPSHGFRKSGGCVGPVLGCCEIKIVDPETRETRVSTDQLCPVPDPELEFEDREATSGELAIRGPNVFEGYYGLPEATAEAFDEEGYFYTGDIARVDEDGYFWIVDRADDMIITGGENVYPAEVEAALYEHPDVAEAGVVGAPHEVKGEAPVAFVVLEEGAEVSERELREFTIDHVATYAHPRRVFFVDELPRSATQKTQRYKLEAMATERLDRPLTSSEWL
jgi:long-chain acyl-CoA synthetase